MNEIDWSKAPEGATHYLAENKKHGWFACWYKYGSNEWLCMSDSNRHGWIADNDDVELFEPMLIKRPTTPSWSGEGLPPVGVVCMANGYQVVIVAHHCNGIHAIYAESEVDGLLYYGEPNEFRPIRTPEQIAADKRKIEAIKMFNIYCETTKSDGANMDGFLALYDLGFRKP